MQCTLFCISAYEHLLQNLHLQPTFNPLIWVHTISWRSSALAERMGQEEMGGCHTSNLASNRKSPPCQLPSTQPTFILLLRWIRAFRCTPRIELSTPRPTTLNASQPTSNHTMVVYKRVNQRLESNCSKCEICRNGSLASCGVACSPVPQYSCWYALHFLQLISFIYVFQTDNNYHHSTKLYWKISQVCCRLYCYECTARAQPGSMVTKILSQTFDFITCSDTSVQLAVPDTDSRVICSTDTNSRVTCSIKNTAFYKLHTAARLPHWLTFSQVRRIIKVLITSNLYTFFSSSSWRWMIPKHVLKPVSCDVTT